MKTIIMQGAMCSMVSNATAASCEAKGCTYRGDYGMSGMINGMNRSYIAGGGGTSSPGESFGGSGSESGDSSVGKNCSDGNCSAGSYSAGSFGGGGDRDGYGGFGGSGGCDYSPSSADVAILMTAEIPGTQPVVGLLYGCQS